jgi:nucleotide-binding universal stress UspA family protein
MFTSILVPLDGSKTAENALPYAQALAGNLKLPVTLLTVVDVAELATRLPAARARYIDAVVESEIRSGNDYLIGVAKSFKETHVACAVERGRADEAIVARAGRDRGTLITMATHGRSGLNRWLLGSVAEKILRSTANPLLLIRAVDEFKPAAGINIKAIVVPLDGSELAEGVLPTVIDLAKALRLEVMLLRGYELAASAYYGEEYLPDYESLKARIGQETRSYLEGRVAALKANGLERVFATAVEGPAAEEIIKQARQRGDAMVAMCTHGRSGIRRWVLGSVTEKVVRHSSAPVMVISAKARSAATEPTVGGEFGKEVSGAMRYTID